MTDETYTDFEEVLCWSEWWDCPRFGIALIGGGVEHFFDCSFSDELDDYPADFQGFAGLQRGTDKGPFS
jgi:hypothetical protein